MFVFIISCLLLLVYRLHVFLSFAFSDREEVTQISLPESRKKVFLSLALNHRLHPLLPDPRVTLRGPHLELPAQPLSPEVGKVPNL